MGFSPALVVRVHQKLAYSADLSFSNRNIGVA